MKVELKALSLNDGEDVYEMFQLIPAEENGTINHMNGLTFAGFMEQVARRVAEAKQDEIIDGRVQQIYYILYIDDIPVGYAKFRTALTDELRVNGGNIGYAMARPYRGRGYGKILLSEVLKKTKERSLAEVLITVNDDNIPSYKMVESCGGILQKVQNDMRYYIIKL